MSYNKSLFQGVPKKHANKSRFNLSHEYKAQALPGYLIPIMTLECLPLDNWEIDSEFMFRFSPMYFPLMQKFTMRADYFYIPNRILWQEGSGANVGWKKWIAEQEEILPPTMDATLRYLESSFTNSVLSYMGLPLNFIGTGVSVLVEGLNAFPLSAYLKIWDEYYRNPQLEGERWFNLQAGDNTSNFTGAFAPWVEVASPILNCLPAKYEKDYFTSALPTPQIGEAILIPSLGIDPDTGEYITNKVYNPDGTVAANGAIEVDAGDLVDSDGTGAAIETQATIKQFRLAEVLQSFYERVMKVGTRYRDFIEGLWGDDPEPMAVDVPVLIGSKFGRVQVADVMTQAYTNLGTDLKQSTGNYVGQANLYEGNSGKLHYYCREHGWLMCILQVNPNTSYGQGIERFWRRTLQTDYPLDMFSGIGDQEILKEEVLYTPLTAEAAKNQETFGYIPRFSEMRYKNNFHHSNLNYNFGTSQHGGRILDTTYFDDMEDVVISKDFVSTYSKDLPNLGDIRTSDMFRILPTPTGATGEYEGIIYMHIFHSVFVERALPLYSTPQL